MSAPLRGTQSLVGQMGWVFQRPLLTALEMLWRWTFGIPFVVVVLFEAIKILIALPPASSGLSSLDPQNPWVAAVQLSNAWTLYQPHIHEVMRWLLPAAALAWVVVSALGRSLLFKQLDPSLAFRPAAMLLLQAAWLALFAFTCLCWLCSMQWVASATITPAAEPDLVGYSVGVIFLSLGFFTAWALLSWPFSIAPMLMLLEKRSAFSALGQAFRLGKPMTAKLVEINLVMGIVKLALVVLAMVLSAAPLPFSDQLGPGALHVVWVAATVFFLVACDYFHVVRLRGFLEFWKMFRGQQVNEQINKRA
jgi:hypothetical protein